ncbi:hypothetical protein [Anoxynatronum sibiricum]
MEKEVVGMKQVCFVTEANGSIGMGHVTRCAAMAAAFTENNCQALLMTGACENDTLSQSIGKIWPGLHQTYPLEKAYGQAGWNQQRHHEPLPKLVAMLEVMEGKPSDRLVILDRYDLSEDWVVKLQTVAGKVGYVDDYHHQIHQADFVINHQVGAEKENRPGGFYGELPVPIKLLGSHYALLRSEFRAVPPRKIRPVVRHILIMTGGGNQFGWQEKLLAWSQEIRPQLESISQKTITLHLLTGATGLLFKQWQDETQHLNDVIVYPRLENLTPVMNYMDLAVTAGGGTLYELAAWGVPALSLMMAENQRHFVNVLEENGVTRSLGWHETLDRKTYQQRLMESVRDTDWRQTCSRHMQQLVDGKGPDRIVEALLESRGVEVS